MGKLEPLLGLQLVEIKDLEILLKMCEGPNNRKKLLSEHYPGLYISILRHMDKQKDL